MNLLLFVLCLTSGVVAGMGMGGGTLLIPVLTLFFGFEQHLAQGINLLVFLPCATASLVVHFKNKLVGVREAVYLMLFGVLAALPAAFFALRVQGDLLKRLFGGFLIVIGILQLVSVILNIRKGNNIEPKKHYKVAIFTTKMFK